jgi:hypothetical protein
MQREQHCFCSIGDAIAQAPATSLTGRSTRTPTQAMPSALSWPVLVPFAFGYGAG